jgi:spore germination protein KB
MIIPILALGVGFATKPLTSLARTAELFAPLIIISTVLLSLLLSANVPIANILPLFSNGISTAVEGALTFPVWFGDVSLLLVCLGNVKLSNRVVLKSMIFRFLSVVFVLIFSLIMFSTYADITDLIDYGHNVSSMTQYSLGSHDYGRFDYIIYCFWMLAVIVKIMLNFFTLSQNVRYVIGKNSQYIIPIAVAVAVYILTTFVLKNENAMYQVSTSVLRFVFIPAEFLLPFIVFILAIIKFDKAEEKDKKEIENERKADEESMA